MKIFSILGAIAALIFASPAYADCIGIGQCQGQAQGQIQGQKQGQIQGQGQSQRSYNRNSNRNSNRNTAVGVGVAKSKSYSNSGGNSISIRGDDVDPPAYAPSVSLTSHGCVGSAGGSAGAAGVISLGFGTTEEQERCTKMEAAKIFISLGMKDEAISLLKSIDWVKDALKKQEPKQARGDQSEPAPVAMVEKRQVAMARPWIDPDRDRPWSAPASE